MSNPRKSKANKLLSNTDRPSRSTSTPMALRLNNAPSPPAVLSKRAADEWRQLAPIAVWLGTLGSSDLRGFELLCETLATEAEARADVGKRGYSIPTGDGGLKANPAVRTMETARSQAARLLDAFALTPRGRAAVDTAPLGASGGGHAAEGAEGAPSPAPPAEDAAYARLVRLRAVKGAAA